MTEPIGYRQLRNFYCSAPKLLIQKGTQSLHTGICCNLMIACYVRVRRLSPAIYAKGIHSCQQHGATYFSITGENEFIVRRVSLRRSFGSSLHPFQEWIFSSLPLVFLHFRSESLTTKKRQCLEGAKERKQGAMYRWCMIPKIWIQTCVLRR